MGVCIEACSCSIRREKSAGGEAKKGVAGEAALDPGEVVVEEGEGREETEENNLGGDDEGPGDDRETQVTAASATETAESEEEEEESASKSAASVSATRSKGNATPESETALDGELSGKRDSEAPKEERDRGFVRFRGENRRACPPANAQW